MKTKGHNRQVGVKVSEKFKAGAQFNRTNMESINSTKNRPNCGKVHMLTVYKAVNLKP